MIYDVTSIKALALTVGEWRYISDMIKIASGEIQNEELKNCLLTISLELNPDTIKIGKSEAEIKEIKKALEGFNK